MSVQLINPANGLALTRDGDRLTDASGETFPVLAGVPRICATSNYTENFGKQWNAFPLTQIDGAGGALASSAKRFFAETGWRPQDLNGLDVLEVGSGAGRFSRVVLEHTRANLYSVDYSSAVEANFQTNHQLGAGRLHLFQASIYEMPFPDGSFDKVFCLGVLQHTPSFRRSVEALVRKAKPGGEIVVDFYPIRGWWTKVHAKYIFRPITKQLSHDRLMRLIDRNADWLIRTHKRLSGIGLGALTRFLPVVDLRSLPEDLPPEALREWVLLDTFDQYSPEYDNPQRISTVARWFRDSGAEVTFADFVDNASGRAAVVRAIRC